MQGVRAWRVRNPFELQCFLHKNIKELKARPGRRDRLGSRCGRNVIFSPYEFHRTQTSVSKPAPQAQCENSAMISHAKFVILNSLLKLFLNSGKNRFLQAANMLVPVLAILHSSKKAHLLCKPPTSSLPSLIHFVYLISDFLLFKGSILFDLREWCLILNEFKKTTIEQA